MISRRRAVLKTNTLPLPESMTSPLPSPWCFVEICVVAIQGTKSPTHSPSPSHLDQLLNPNETNSTIKFPLVVMYHEIKSVSNANILRRTAIKFRTLLPASKPHKNHRKPRMNHPNFSHKAQRRPTTPFSRLKPLEQTTTEANLRGRDLSCQPHYRLQRDSAFQVRTCALNSTSSTQLF